jgi:hypothetical protein
MHSGGISVSSTESRSTTMAAAIQRENGVVRLLTVAFFIGITVVLCLPLLSRASWMIFVQDDFLYYLQVAQNIAHGNGSTFNCIVPTNGYQPLWLFVLVVLSRLTENPRLILMFLAISNLAAAAATFLLARSLLRSTNVRPLLVFALTAWTTLYSLTLFFYGMEVTLTVPLILGLLCLLRRWDWLERGPLQTAALGLLLSAMVLARIDTLILAGLLLIGILMSPVLRRTIRPSLVIGLLIGLLPLVLYFTINHALFNTWLPISGMAKELKKNHAPSMEPWRVFFHPLAGFFTLVLLAAAALFSRVRNSLAPIERIFFPAILTFPFLYYFILSCVSDWTLWGWYMYPIRTALCVSFMTFCLYPPLAKFLQRPLVTGFLLLTVFTCLALLRWTRQQTDIYAASVEIQQFSSTHPGTYAMGDRAGRVATLIPYPVIQTEGLMMDREYLRYVQRETPLRETLAHYNVRYYVATAYEPFSGCFQAVEPAKAGPNSAHMRAEFCEPPVATYLHDGIETLIFDLQQKK